MDSNFSRLAKMCVCVSAVLGAAALLRTRADTATIDDYGRADTGSANAGYWDVSGRGATVVHQAVVSIDAMFLSGGWDEAESAGSGSQLESRMFTAGTATLARSLETDLPGSLFILR